eukprot:gene29026-36006_t
MHTRRWSSSMASRPITQSAGGSCPATLSGHSMSLRPGPAKMSRKPASSHS